MFIDKKQFASRITFSLEEISKIFGYYVYIYILLQLKKIISTLIQLNIIISN